MSPATMYRESIFWIVTGTMMLVIIILVFIIIQCAVKGPLLP